MPDPSQSTPAPIPRIVPSNWEEHEGFRETLLLHYADPEANEVLRGLGRLLFNQALERTDQGPARPESLTRSELRAALADLRFVEGFLGAVGQGHVVSSLSSDDTTLSRFAAGQALKLSRIADEIEQAVGLA